MNKASRIKTEREQNVINYVVFRIILEAFFISFLSVDIGSICFPLCVIYFTTKKGRN